MKKIILNIKVWWFWLFQIKLYTEFESKKWSDTLIEMANNGVLFTDIKDYEAQFGKYTLWIGNEPYAGFNVYVGLLTVTVERIYPNKEACYILHCLLKKSIDIQNKKTIKAFEQTLN